MYNLSESEMSNMCVKQKDRVLRLINQGKLAEAQLVIDVLREFWHHAEYDYKTRELEQRIASEVFKAA